MLNPALGGPRLLAEDPFLFTRGGKEPRHPAGEASPALAKPVPSEKPSSGSQDEPTSSTTVPPDGRPGTADPARAVRPLSGQENISLRELKEGVAPSEHGPVDDPDLGL